MTLINKLQKLIVSLIVLVCLFSCKRNNNKPAKLTYVEWLKENFYSSLPSNEEYVKDNHFSRGARDCIENILSDTAVNSNTNVLDSMTFNRMKVYKNVFPCGTYTPMNGFVTINGQTNRYLLIRNNFFDLEYYNNKDFWRYEEFLLDSETQVDTAFMEWDGGMYIHKDKGEGLIIRDISHINLAHKLNLFFRFYVNLLG